MTHASINQWGSPFVLFLPLYKCIRVEFVEAALNHAKTPDASKRRGPMNIMVPMKKLHATATQKAYTNMFEFPFYA